MSRLKLGVIGLLLTGIGLAGTLFLALRHREFLRDQLEQRAGGSFMLDMYHNLKPREYKKNNIPYSIFDSQTAWQIEDDDARRGLPEFTIIKGIDPKDAATDKTAPSMRFNKWERSGADLYSSKYSERDQINKSNVKDLVLAWTYHSKETVWHTNVETNPIVAGRNLFVTTPGDFLVSIDATTGVENWRIPMHMPARRGLLWWAGNSRQSPRLFVPSTEGVYAIDPASGKAINDFGNGGRVGSKASVVAPVVDGDRLIIATIASMTPLVGPHGALASLIIAPKAPSIEAYNVEFGKLLWETPLLNFPETSAADIRDFRLSGGSPWAGLSLDSARSRIYVSTGNPAPQIYGAYRPGRNEFSCSVVSIDTTSGQIKWSFQEVAHDLWDFDIPSPPVLVKVRKENKTIDAVAVVTKIGNTLLLDRDRGRPIFDFRSRRAPTSKVPGEQTWPYQPDVELPEPFMRQAFERSDITDIGESERATVELKLKNTEFGFFVPPSINGKVVNFGLHGGAEWPGAAADQNTGILYIPSNRYPWVLRLFYSEELSNPVRSTDKAGDALYQDKCAGCHGVRREGYYEPEFNIIEAKGDASVPDDKPYPSLVGITASRNISGTAWFEKTHAGMESIKALSQKEVEAINRYLSAADHFSDDRRSLAVSFVWQLLRDGKGHPGSKPPWGMITAIDLNSGRQVWQIPFGEYKELTARGIPVTGQPNFGGLIVTKGGLIFATGTVDEKIRAFDLSSGVQLWDYDLPAVGSAPPATYEIDGIQYLVVVATGGRFTGKHQSDTILAFRLRAAQSSPQH